MPNCWLIYLIVYLAYNIIGTREFKKTGVQINFGETSDKHCEFQPSLLLKFYVYQNNKLVECFIKQVRLDKRIRTEELVC